MDVRRRRRCLQFRRLLAGAILFRPPHRSGMILSARLDHVWVQIVDGTKATRRSLGDGARLAPCLRDNGATVTTDHVLLVGHAMMYIAHDRVLARLPGRSEADFVNL